MPRRGAARWVFPLRGQRFRSQGAARWVFPLRGQALPLAGGLRAGCSRSADRRFRSHPLRACKASQLGRTTMARCGVSARSRDSPLRGTPTACLAGEGHRLKAYGKRPTAYWARERITDRPLRGTPTACLAGEGHRLKAYGQTPTAYWARERITDRSLRGTPPLAWPERGWSAAGNTHRLLAGEG
jgi:hypothetical protein